MNDHAILSHPYDTAHLPAVGVDLAIEASKGERAALTEAYDLVAVGALTATATLVPAGGGLVTVEGRVTADIVQSCVVSLQPVPQHIDEAFSVRFAPAATAASHAPAAGKEVAIDPEAPDPPEAMEGTTIDVGALVEEMFVLAIDPYPRAPGAELADEAVDAADSPEESPFAVLRGVVRSGK
jgi:uncharacterized metal-binding protein YceD (DUF177 family)